MYMYKCLIYYCNAPIKSALLHFGARVELQSDVKLVRGNPIACLKDPNSYEIVFSKQKPLKWNQLLHHRRMMQGFILMSIVR